MSNESIKVMVVLRKSNDVFPKSIVLVGSY